MAQKTDLTSLQIKTAEIEIDVLKKLFKEKGYDNPTFGEPEFYESGSILTETISKIDSQLLRAMSKVAFNYLAFVKGHDFVLSSDFDPVRNYIRWGIETFKYQSWLDQDPIVQNEVVRSKLTMGHFIAVDWDPRLECLLGRASFFNQFRYNVTLTLPGTRLKEYPMPSGHFFNLQTKKILKLRSSSIQRLSR